MTTKWGVDGGEGEMPEHVKKMAQGGYACASCGGMVGEDGRSPMADDEDEARFGPDDDDDAGQMDRFVMAIKGRGK